MNQRYASVLVLALLIVVACSASEAPESGVKPKNGFVPDAKTAIKIAVAVWEPIFGETKIAKEKPYKARLGTNGVWIVHGSLPTGYDLGGVAEAEIAKEDGRILKVSHSK